MDYHGPRKGHRRRRSRRTMLRPGRTYNRRYRLEFYDPNAQHHDLPTYPWNMAPEGLATRRQLLALELRPGGQPIAAQILWIRRNKIAVAYLYRIDLALPKRTPSLAQLLSLDKALQARRTCPTCRTDVGYTIPTRLGECVDCHHARVGNSQAA